METPVKTEVLVTGTFNLVHAGHIRLLEFASRYGLVTVGINSDNYLLEKYGERTVPLVDRAYVLRSNRFVQNVVVFNERHPGKLILKLKPDFYVKGPDYKDMNLPENTAISQVGCKLIIQPTWKEYNSSELVTVADKSIFKEFSKLY